MLLVDAVAVQNDEAPGTVANVAALPFTDCSSSSSASSISIHTVYAQLNPRHFFNLTILASSSQPVFYSSNTTNPLLSTVFAPTSVLTFTLNPDAQSKSAFCHTLRPPSPLPQIHNDSSGYCPLQPGPLAFSVSTPLMHSYELMTLNTQIRVLDTSNPAQELACIRVPATQLHNGVDGSVYGHAVIVFWVSVALAIAYWLIVGAARLAAAWKRGRQRVHNNIWSHVQGLGFVLASAISGERFASSPALMRFGTPSMRDVIFHTQWCTLLGMTSVQWPSFAYPYFAQTAWASLLYNVSLTQGPSDLWDPLHTEPFRPPAEFADQLADPTSPLFLDPNIPNTLFTLPPGIPQTGIPALVASVGLRPRDAFNNSVAIFVLILAGTVFLSLLVFVIDWLLASLFRVTQRRTGTGSKTPPWSSGTQSLSHKEFGESPEPISAEDDLGAGNGNVRFLHRPASRTLLRELPTQRGWLSQRLGQSSFHGSVLHGNLVRILILFHLPVTTLSCYQFSSGRAQSSLAAVILAALSFAVFSIIIPTFLIFRLSTTPTNKLYDETRTLLALGPLYNHYAHGSQLFACLLFATNIAYGVTLGCGQRSGSAQAIIMLVVEVFVALMTSVWLPWGRGAAMGGVSFILCVARIITAVLLVILSPVVNVGTPAGGWITYAILVIQAIVYLGFSLMLIFKIFEAFVRIIWDLSFDRSKHTVDTGLFGAIGLASRRRSSTAAKRRLRSSHGSDSTMLPLREPNMNVASNSRTTVSGPPSVLRPEQLNQPYREDQDSDDEGGYILGAWRYDDEIPASATEGSSAVPSRSQNAKSPTSPPSNSGFSRVAGGRANINSPYTMAAGTATSFGARGSSAGLGAGASGTQGNIFGVNPVGGGGSHSGGDTARTLPPGAMAPGHIPHARRKSQSAIIEDLGGNLSSAGGSGGASMSSSGTGYSGFAGLGTSSRSHSTGVRLPPPLSPSAEGSDEDDDIPPKRKPWFGRRLFSPSSGDHRRNGEGVEEGSPNSPRTFVVIRERRPSPLSQAQLPEPEQDQDQNQNQEEQPHGTEQGTTRSFTVLRPDRSGGQGASRASPLPPAYSSHAPSSSPDLPVKTSPRNRD